MANASDMEKNYVYLVLDSLNYVHSKISQLTLLRGISVNLLIVPDKDKTLLQ